jgi:threonine dehydratase
MEDIEMISAADVDRAAERIAPHIRRTPLLRSVALSEDAGADLAIKAEHQQHTGSFKFRGALNRLARLPAAERRAGVVTASSGNHGLAVVAAGAVMGAEVTVVVPAGASPAKLAGLRRGGATVITVDDPDTLAAETHGRALASEQGRTYIPPYNDPDVVAGQGTIAPELAGQLRDIGWDRLDAVVVAVGGGGLVSGIATWLAAHTDTVVVGAQPENDAAMAAAVRAGHPVDVHARHTLSDGTAGGIEAGAITVSMCRDLVDEWVLASERDIAVAIARVIDAHHTLIEGSAGVAIAAAAHYAADHPGQRIAAISCGANISAHVLRDALALAAV